MSIHSTNLYAVPASQIGLEWTLCQLLQHRPETTPMM